MWEDDFEVRTKLREHFIQTYFKDTLLKVLDTTSNEKLYKRLGRTYEIKNYWNCSGGVDATHFTLAPNIIDIEKPFPWSIWTTFLNFIKTRTIFFLFNDIKLNSTRGMSPISAKKLNFDFPSMKFTGVSKFTIKDWDFPRRLQSKLQTFSVDYHLSVVREFGLQVIDISGYDTNKSSYFGVVVDKCTET